MELRKKGVLGAKGFRALDPIADDFRIVASFPTQLHPAVAGIDPESPRHVGDPPLLARVPQAVGVGVPLVRVQHVRAVVAVVANEIAVSVLLAGIGAEGTVITGVAEAVTVSVLLEGVRDVWTVVARLPQEITIDVRLIPIRGEGTVVAGAAEPVQVVITVVRVQEGSASYAESTRKGGFWKNAYSPESGRKDTIEVAPNTAATFNEEYLGIYAVTSFRVPSGHRHPQDRLGVWAGWKRNR
jgi:hypothetical protein